MCLAIEEMRNEAIEQDIRGIVGILRSMNAGDDEICEKIMSAYDLSREDAERYASAAV